MMSEPDTYVLKLPMNEEAIPQWLGAPMPDPTVWKDWNQLDTTIDENTFSLARRFTNQPVRNVLKELAASQRGGWHFKHANDELQMIALEASENWYVHVMYLCALRTAEGLSIGAGAAISDAYLWDAGEPSWNLVFDGKGASSLVQKHLPVWQSALDKIAMKAIDSAREGDFSAFEDEYDASTTEL